MPLVHQALRHVMPRGVTELQLLVGSSAGIIIDLLENLIITSGSGFLVHTCLQWILQYISAAASACSSFKAVSLERTLAGVVHAESKRTWQWCLFCATCDS